MPSVTARRKCPELVFVKPRFDVYKEVSLQIRTIFAERYSAAEKSAGRSKGQRRLNQGHGPERVEPSREWHQYHRGYTKRGRQAVAWPHTGHTQRQKRQ